MSTGIQQIIAILSVKPANSSEVEVKRYSLNPEANHGALTIALTPAGTILIEVDGEHSKLFPVGNLNCCVTVKIEDANFSVGYRTEKFGANVGKINAGCGLDVVV